MVSINETEPANLTFYLHAGLNSCRVATLQVINLEFLQGYNLAESKTVARNVMVLTAKQDIRRGTLKLQTRLTDPQGNIKT